MLRMVKDLLHCTAFYDFAVVPDHNRLRALRALVNPDDITSIHDCSIHNAFIPLQRLLFVLP